MENKSPQEFADEIFQQIKNLQEEAISLPWHSSYRLEGIQAQIMRKRSILIALEQSDGVKPTAESEIPKDMNEALQREWKS